MRRYLLSDPCGFIWRFGPLAVSVYRGRTFTRRSVYIGCLEIGFRRNYFGGPNSGLRFQWGRP